MEPNRRRAPLRGLRFALVIALLVALLLAVGALVARRTHRRAAHALETSAPTDVAGSAPESGHERARSAGPAARAWSFKRGARTLVPPPPVAALAARDPQAGAPAAFRHPRRLDPGGGGFLDRRPEAGADSGKLREALAARMKEARAGAEHCLDGWAQEDASLAEGVVLAFSVDEQGLQEVSIKDRSDVPGGALACIANSVYPIDWGGLTQAPIQVTVRIRYAPRDAGPASDA